MVRVPERHVPAVERLLRRLEESEQRAAGWDVESMERLFEGCDEMTRAVLSYLARPEAAEGVRRQQVARALELKGYVRKILKDLRERARAEFGRESPVGAAKITKGSRQIPVVKVSEDVAQLVRDAERAVHRRESGDRA